MSEILYGVYDESLLSLRPTPADTVCPTLEDALAEACDMVINGSKKAAVYVCRYYPKKDEAYPIDLHGCITVEASEGWKPIEEDE